MLGPWSGPDQGCGTGRTATLSAAKRREGEEGHPGGEETRRQARLEVGLPDSRCRAIWRLAASPPPAASRFGFDRDDGGTGWSRPSSRSSTGRRQLVEAVESVLAQDYRPVEVIIVDDGSTDGVSGRVADELASRPPRGGLRPPQPNGGPGRARETGRLAARGEFIQYLDSDDLLLPDKFRLQVAGLRAQPECGVSYGWTRYRAPMEDSTRRAGKARGTETGTLFPSFLRERWWDTPTPLLPPYVCDAAGPWSEQWLEEDWEYDCRVAALGMTLHHHPAFVAEVTTTARRGSPARATMRGGAGPARPLPRTDPRPRCAGLGWARPARDAALRARTLPAGAAVRRGRAGDRVAQPVRAGARDASGERGGGADFRLYRAAPPLLGWRLTGRLACWSDQAQGLTMCGINGLLRLTHGAPPLDRDELLRSARRHGGARTRRGGPVALTGRPDRPRSPAAGDPRPERRRRAADAQRPTGVTCHRLQRRDLQLPRAARRAAARGRAFRSQSDTEVLLALFAREDVAMLGRLRGMFALAIWDERERRLVLARDTFGIKPLYYADDGRRAALRLAGQGALEAGRRVARPSTPCGLAGFLLWGSVPEPWTIRKAVRAVPAGALAGGPRRTRRRRPGRRSRRAPADESRARVEAAVAESVARTWCPTCRSACSSRPGSTRR